MTGTHSVDIQLLHHTDVPNHVSLRQDISLILIELVPVDSLDKDWLAIDKKLRALDLHCPESEIKRGALGESALSEGLDFQCVKVRSLRTPKSWFFYGSGSLGQAFL